MPTTKWCVRRKQQLIQSRWHGRATAQGTRESHRPTSRLNGYPRRIMLLQIRSCIRRVLAGRVDRRLESKVIANDDGFVLILEMKVKNTPKVTFYVVISTSCNDSQYTWTMDSSTHTVMAGNNLNKWFIIPRPGGGPAITRAGLGVVRSPLPA